MGSLPFTRGSDLRRRLRATGAGGIIHLEHGNEYQGPFILDKPVSLVGHGAATQLFGKGGPALLVRAPGVRLEHLGLVDSHDPEAGICLLFEEGARPELVDVLTEGRMTTLTRDQVVDLGELLPQQKGFSLLEVEVKGPSEVRCAESSERWLWAGIGEGMEKALSAAGKYLLRLGCDARNVGVGGMALGEVVLTTGAEVRTFWVAVQVLPETPVGLPGDVIALRPGKGHLIRFNDGFVIGKNRFPGLTAANGMPDRQAIVLRENGGAGWAVFQPWATPSPTLVNGAPLALGQRCLLYEGDTLRAGGLDLKVESVQGGGLLTAAKALVDLGTTAGSPPRADVRLRYNGSGKETVKISAAVPWVRVSPSSCELKGDEEKDLQVGVTHAATALPPAKYRERGAILVQAKGETLCLDVALEVLPDFIAPRSSGSLDLGKVSEWEKAAVIVKIGNGGTKVWRPAVRVGCDWLTAEPAKLTVPSGSDVPLRFRLNDKVLGLSPVGPQTVPVRIEGDGSSLDLRFTAYLDLDLSPDPRLVMANLDFLSIEDPTGASPTTVVIQNRGRSEWRAGVRAVPWLDVPAEVKVPAGKQKSFLVRVNGKLPAGTHDVPDALVLEGDGKSLAIRARVTFRPVPFDLQVEPGEIDLTVEDGGDLSLLRRSLCLRNQGRRPWAGKIEALVPWLEVAPSRGVVPVGGRLDLVADVTEAVRDLGSGEHVFDRVIAFEGLSLGTGARVKLLRRRPARSADPRMTSSAPRSAPEVAPSTTTPIATGAFRFSVAKPAEAAEDVVDVQPLSLDFGQVSNWNGVPAQTVTISNRGGTPMTVVIERRADWLTVSPPERLDCPAGASSEITVSLRPSPFQRKGLLHDPQAVVIEVAGRRLRLAGRVETI